MTLDEGTYYLPLLSLLRKAAERCTCGSFVRSLPAMELPSSQTPFCAAPKAGPHTTHTHIHAHTHQECRWWASIRSSRSPFQDLPCSQPSHSHTDTYAHTHTYSLSRSLSFSIIAHDARTINESSTVNKRGRKQKVVWCFTYSSRSSSRSRSRRGGGEEEEEEPRATKKQLGHRYRSITRKILVFFLFSLFLSCHLLLLLRSPLEHGR